MTNVDRGAPANLNSGKAWSPVDVSDLRHSLARGFSVEATADFLCRDAAEVAAKARELGLTGGRSGNARRKHRRPAK